MSISHVLLTTYSIISLISYTTANRNRNNTFTSFTSLTNTTSIILPNDNIGDDRSSLLISTFFDLLWYIIALFAFCICCVSCLLLFYLQQTRKYDNKIENQISVCQTLGPKIPTKTNSTPPSTYTRSTTNTSNTTNKIYTISPPPNNPSSISVSKSSTYVHTKHNNISACSLSAFSGVDSQGVDMDDKSYKTESVFKNLGPIADEFEPSSSKSINEPQPTEYNMYVKSKNNETEDDMSSESSVYSNEQTIIAIMKKRSVKSPNGYEKNNKKFNIKYEKRKNGKDLES